MWFATGAGAALVAGAGWALWSRRRTRTRVA
jgi:LPXTG-motif cell wall-anchored protein